MAVIRNKTGVFISLFTTCMVITGPLLCGYINAPMNREIAAAYISTAALCCIAIVVVFSRHNNRVINLSAPDIGLTVCIIYYVIRILLTGREHVDYTVFLLISAVALCYIFSRMSSSTNIIVIGVLISSMLQSMIIFAQHTGLIPSGNIVYPCTGSFDNPAPAACYIVLGITASLLFIKHYRHITSICILLQLSALYILSSTAAWAALIAGILYVIYMHVGSIVILGKVITTLICAGILLLIIIGSHSPSAKGRMMIWDISIPLMLRNPVFGLGEGAFHREYMLVQAQYFTEHMKSPYISVADNIIYPFNEYIGIIVGYGLFGIVLTAGVIILTFKASGQKNSFLLSCIVAFMVFAGFSYPSESLPLLILISVLSGRLELPSIYRFKFNMPIKAGITFISLSAIIVSSGEYHSLLKLNNAVNELYKSGKDIEDDLYNKYVGNRNFNDYYMAQLSRDKNMISNPRINDAFPSCENFVAIGTFHYAKLEFVSAEYYFKQASAMLPNRIIPRYKLWELYSDIGMTEKALKVAHDIISTKEKIESTYTLSIKKKMRQFIDTNNS